MGKAAFAGIEPVVKRKVIGGGTAMFALRRERVMIRVHGVVLRVEH
jgi:hypothetical protein